MSNSGETPIIVPRPVPVIIKENRIVILTKFFSWLTAALLAVAVIISLVSVVSSRNDLRDELTCRSRAVLLVNKAAAVRENLIAKGLIFASNNDTAALTELVPKLQDSTIAVDESIKAQEVALAACSH